MKKIINKIKSTISAIIHYKQIQKSYSLLIQSFEPQNEEQIKRINICLQCKHIDINGNNCFVKGTQPCCSICGCAIKMKTIEPNNHCPINKW